MSEQRHHAFTGSLPRRRGIIALLVLIFLVISTLFVGRAYAARYTHTFYPGVHINSFAVGGKKPADVLEQLKQLEREIQSRGLVFTFATSSVALPLVPIATDPDLARPLVTFDWQGMIDEAYAVGRQGTWAQQWLERLRVRVSKLTIAVRYSIDEQELIGTLTSNFDHFEQQPREALLDLSGTEPTVIAERAGTTFEYLLAVSTLKQQLQALSFAPIPLTITERKPTITAAEATAQLGRVQQVLDLPPITITASSTKKTWTFSPKEKKSWLEFQILGPEIVIGVNKEKAIEYLTAIAEEINVAAQDARFSIVDGRVKEFLPSQDGIKVNIDESYARINQHIIFQRTEQLPLSVEIDVAKVTTEDANDLGIRELLGVGHSNFSGSPANRRHNIKVGVDSLNGILIAPNEEFSLLEALGEIDGEHGYLQELVIKGNRTIPEYGGGLCQIGSTTFRAALRSGLPITARRNHSYRVRYYEPAGMDATIYDPAPDFRFLNDTKHHVLFVARMEKDDLYFEFYGTDDGREVELSPDPPRIYNIVQPSAPKYIETTDLPPGEKKKVESSHVGADAYFKYTVTYADGTVKEKDFYSHYVPWQEVWFVGVTPTSTPAGTEFVEIIEEIPAE